jgi:pyruvate/2-oxoglutarate dehydrogenase complex dihydrolipoamide dehydrogenase (E3) component
VSRQTDVICAQLRRSAPAVYQGLAKFADPYTIEVQGHPDTFTLRAEIIVIACGTRAPLMPRAAAFSLLGS